MSKARSLAAILLGFSLLILALALALYSYWSIQKADKLFAEALQHTRVADLADSMALHTEFGFSQTLAYISVTDSTTRVFYQDSLRQIKATNESLRDELAARMAGISEQSLEQYRALVQARELYSASSNQAITEFERGNITRAINNYHGSTTPHATAFVGQTKELARAYAKRANALSAEASKASRLGLYGMAINTFIAVMLGFWLTWRSILSLDAARQNDLPPELRRTARRSPPAYPAGLGARPGSSAAPPEPSPNAPRPGIWQRLRALVQLSRASHAGAQANGASRQNTGAAAGSASAGASGGLYDGASGGGPGNASSKGAGTGGTGGKPGGALAGAPGGGADNAPSTGADPNAPASAAGSEPSAALIPGAAAALASSTGAQAGTAPGAPAPASGQPEAAPPAEPDEDPADMEEILEEYLRQSHQELQRRTHFRVRVPYRNPAKFQVLDPALGIFQHEFEIYDISAGGLRLLDPDKLLAAYQNQSLNGSLLIPTGANISLTIQMLRVMENLAVGRKKGINTAAGMFIDTSSTQLLLVQQYVDDIERKIMQQRQLLV